MSSLTSRFQKFYDHMMHDSMRRNSTLLILSQATLAGSMFLFFIINAHLLPASSVGLAASFISFGLLVATFTNLGLPNTIIRFLAKSERREVVALSAVALVSLSSLIGGCIAVLIIPEVSPKLGFIRSSPLLSVTLVLLVSGSALSALLDGTLVALKRAEFVFVKSVITNAPRIVLPFFLATAGVKGMTNTYVVTLVIGVLFNLYGIFYKLLRITAYKLSLSELSEHRAYAASNYFGGMFGVLPATLVPIIILNRLGPSAAAYYYMPAQIALFLSVVCNSVSQSLISESSQTDDEALHKLYFRKAFKHQYQLLIPLVIFLCVAGWPILLIYGHDYVKNGLLPLLILAGSSLIVGLNWLGDTWLNVKKRNRDYLLMNAFNSLATIAFVYLFSVHGLSAAAFGWFCGQLLSAAVYLIIFGRSQLLSLR